MRMILVVGLRTAFGTVKRFVRSHTKWIWILVCLFAMSHAGLSQSGSYTGNIPDNGPPFEPTFNYLQNAVFTCVVAHTSDDHLQHPWCGVFLNGFEYDLYATSPGSYCPGPGLPCPHSVKAPNSGVGQLSCAGASYAWCTLTVQNPGAPPPNHPVPPPPTKPTEQPTDGGYYLGLGGPNQHIDGCGNSRTLLLKTANPKPQAGQPVTVSINILRDRVHGQPLFGCGFCMTTSGGGIDWGDGSPEIPMPTVSAPPKDACAPQGTQRLGSTNFFFTHTYFETGEHRIFAWVQGDFKDNGVQPSLRQKLTQRGGFPVWTQKTLIGADLGSSGSWRCRAQMRLDLNIQTPTNATGLRICQIKKHRRKC